MFKEIEEKFAVFVELPELEKRKKELSKRRELFAPMNPKEINTHEKNYEKVLEEKSHKRRIKINELKTENSVNSSFKNLYKPKIFDIITQADKEKEETAL